LAGLEKGCDRRAVRIEWNRGLRRLERNAAATAAGAAAAATTGATTTATSAATATVASATRAATATATGATATGATASRAGTATGAPAISRRPAVRAHPEAGEIRVPVGRLRRRRVHEHFAVSIARQLRIGYGVPLRRRTGSPGEGDEAGQRSAHRGGANLQVQRCSTPVGRGCFRFGHVNPPGMGANIVPNS
jgi:hypothetical protein